MKTVCIDLDGTLAEYHGYPADGSIGPALAGAAEFVRRLKREYRIVILTARCRTDDDELRINLWLIQNDIPFDEIYRGVGKPAACAYVDDRAVAVPQNPSPKDFSLAESAVHQLASRT